MKLRLVQPEHLVDIGRLDELSYVQRAGDGLRIGAATTYRDIEKSRAVESVAPLLTETARVVGDLQVRNKGTIGGAAAHADPAADVPAALLALEARLRVVGGRRSRVIPAHRFFRRCLRDRPGADRSADGGGDSPRCLRAPGGPT